MARAVDRDHVIGFGPFEFDLTALELRHAGQTVKLGPQPLRVLRLLASRGGEVVTRHEIEREVWGDQTHVDFELGLNYAINRLRFALGDAAASPQYIETLPRRGYRFTAPIRSIEVSRLTLAVLPLDNLSGDPSQDYLSEGLTEEIITAVGRSRPDRLAVIARHSAAVCKRSGRPLDEMAATLGADYFLEGSVRRVGDRVRVSVQLIRAADQTHLWADTYDRSCSDVLTMEAEVGRRVAESLAVGLQPSAQRNPRNVLPIDAEVYDCYLKGRFLFGRWSPDSLEMAVNLFQEAIDRAPHFAPPFSGLADSCSMLGFFDLVRPRDVYPRALRAAARAVELDDESAEAHASLAWVMCCYQWDWDGAGREFARAIALNANYVQAHAWRAFLLTITGRMEEALDSIRWARRLDPLSVMVNTDEACFLYFARKYDEAIAQCHRTIALNPAFGLPYHKLGLCYLGLRQAQPAIAAFEQATSLWEGHPIPLASLAQALAIAGKTQRARDILTQLEQRATTAYVSPLDLSFVYLALGDVDRGLMLMDQACDERESRLPFVRVAPGLEPLAGDPRFRKILARIGLPPADEH